MLEKQILRRFPANNIRACPPKTWWSPSLNSSTSLRQVCKRAHGIFYDSLWLKISSSLSEVFFINMLLQLLDSWIGYSDVGCNPPISHKICTHSVVCRLFFWSSSSSVFETARGSGYILKAFTSLSWSVEVCSLLLSFDGVSCCFQAIQTFARATASLCGAETLDEKAILGLCNTKAMVAWVGTFCYCRKKLLLCSM